MTRGTLLLTGGAGYLGSHTAVAMLQAGWRVVVLDDLSSGHAAALGRVRELAGTDLRLVVGSTLDAAALDAAFAEPVHAVVHLAALKSVPESVLHPERYWRVNVGGTIELVEAMVRHGCRRIVFSSSAAVYAADGSTAVHEGSPVAPRTPYGASKLACEELLAEAARAHRWRALLLRYFNPIGAHPSGRLGEDQRPAHNLGPALLEVVSGDRPVLDVFGRDYPTPDGSAVRDFLHVCDVAEAHRAALAGLGGLSEGDAPVYNVGSGTGCSVLQLVRTLRAVTGHPVPTRFAPRREGDLASVVADVGRFERDFGFRCRRDLQAMVEDAWRWARSQRRAPWAPGTGDLDRVARA